MLGERHLPGPFEAMAVRVGNIPENEFAGAVVIVPPDGEPISILLQSTKADPLRFWGMVKTEVEIRGAEAMQTPQDPWGRR